MDADEARFQSFMKKFGKAYTTTDEYNLRLGHFRTNLLRYARLNREQPHAHYDVDRFSDMSVYEFRNTFLLNRFDANEACQWPFHRVARPINFAAPASWDWRSQTPSPLTPVKDQQQCGSCWSFSTTGNIEGQWVLAGHHTLTSLSEQQLVDCSQSCLVSEPSLCNGGCGGGLPWLAYEDVISWKGITTEAAYPYTASDGSCQTGKAVGAKISNWTALSTDVSQIEAYLAKNGPLSITLNADPLQGYSSGIITGDASSCPGSSSDHAVLLVGYGTDATTKVHYWIVKNSWNTSWGEQGFFRIQADNGLCGINLCVTSSLV